MYEILWGARSSGMYDPNDPQNENLEPYTSNMQEIMANVPPAVNPWQRCVDSPQGGWFTAR